MSQLPLLSSAEDTRSFIDRFVAAVRQSFRRVDTGASRLADRVGVLEVRADALEELAPGPYADDAAAATGGVAVGELYRVTGGTVAWRQT